MESFQKQPCIKSLPSFSVYRKLRLKETDLNEVVKTVEAVLPQYIHGNISVKITLSEKDLKIMAHMALMQEALLNIVKITLDAMPYGGLFSLNTGQVNFENQSIPDGNDDNYGTCAFISLADTGIGLDEKITGRIFDPFFTTKTGTGKGLGLPIAYHIIKEHGGSMKIDSTAGQGTAINVYLPLARPEIVSMNSIPLPAPYCRNLFNNGI